VLGKRAAKPIPPTPLTTLIISELQNLHHEMHHLLDGAFLFCDIFVVCNNMYDILGN